MEQSWKSIVTAGAFIVGLVLLINSSLFIYMIVTEGFHISVTLFSGTKRLVFHMQHLI
jgi:hypothetical protein